MYQVPIIYINQKIVGHITLNSEMENLLKEGFQFTLGASIIETKYKMSTNVIGVTLTLIPSKEKK